MATIVVAYDGTELTGANHETTDGGTWDKLGVTQSPSDEVDFVYEGSQAISNKISGGTGGVDFQSTGTTDLETTPRIVIAIINITTYGLINDATTQGVKYYIGTGAQGTNYYEYDLYGSATDYPARGGFVVVAIDPNVSGYRSRTSGSAPDLTIAEYYGLYADITASVKSENVVHDTLSYVDNGKGITLTRGDAGSTEGVFQDFVDYDEGTTTNRRGIVQDSDGVLIVTGTLTIGESGTATEFTDALGTVIFPDGRVNTGFFGLALDVQNGSTIIDISSYAFTSNGNETTTDTRAELNVVGTSGTITLDKLNIVNFADVILTSAVTLSNSTVATTESFTQAQAILNGNTFDQSPKATGEVFMTVVDPSDLSDNSFISGGNGYAMEATVAGTYSFVGNTFTGYATQTGTATDRAVLWDVEASVYDSQLNGGSTRQVGDGTNISVGQSFTGTGGTLSAAIPSMRKWNSPTGTFIFEVYASTGSDPNRVPTGAALATSETYNAADQPTGLADFHVEFKDEFTLVNATTYFLVLNGTNIIGDGTDHILWEFDPANPDTSNNAAIDTGSWAADTGVDMQYSVHTGGILKLGISGGGSTPSYNITSTIKGTVIAPVSVNITIHTQDANAVDIGAVKVYLTATGGGDLPNGTIIVNDETDGSGDLTTPFTYTNPQDITGWCRKSTTSPFFKNTPISGTITSSGLAILGIMASDE